MKFLRARTITMKKLIIISLMLFVIQVGFSQNAATDVKLAQDLQKKGVTFRKAFNMDSALWYYQKAQSLYIKHLGEKSAENAGCLSRIGILYYFWSKHDLAIKNVKASIAIYQ